MKSLSKFNAIATRLLVCSALMVSASAFAQTRTIDPARFADAVNAFDEAHAKQPEPEGAVLAVGSSSIRFWDTIKTDLAPITIVHRGFGGSTLEDALYYMDRLVLQYKPRAVMLYEGDNDLSVYNVKPDTILEQFNTFTSRLAAQLPNTRIYLLSVKPSIARMEAWSAMKKTNDLLAKRCSQLDNCTFIDVASPMFNNKGEPKPEIFVEDNIHMNAAGYKIWTDTIRPVLVEAEQRFEKRE